MKITAWMLAFFLCSIAGSASESMGCRDKNGEPVDWWIVLKMADGFRYVYRDSNSVGTHFDEPKNNLEDPSPNNPLSHTIRPLYANAANPDLAYIVYNDQPPSDNAIVPEADSKAHAKGIVALYGEQGFWLIHSVPQFLRSPISSGVYLGIPPTARKYGQSFLCVTYAVDAFSVIGAQLQVSNPRILQSKMENRFKPTISTQLLNENESRVQILTSVANTPIVSFAKTRRWQLDLYQHLIAPYFDSDLLVRTWMRAPDNLPTLCAQTDCRDVFFEKTATNTPPESSCTFLCNNTLDDACRFGFNNLLVHLIEFDDATQLFRKDDHSKWAISTRDSSRKVVCIADINTQKTQRARGGGAACIEDANTWAAFYELISDHDFC